MRRSAGQAQRDWLHLSQVRRGCNRLAEWTALTLRHRCAASTEMRSRRDTDSLSDPAINCTRLALVPGRLLMMLLVLMLIRHSRLLIQSRVKPKSYHSTEIGIGGTAKHTTGRECIEMLGCSCHCKGGNLCEFSFTGFCEATTDVTT